MRNIWMISCAVAAATMACSSTSGEANDATDQDQRLQLKDREYLEALRKEFLEVSGKDYVEFEKGSSELGPSSQFRLERQAIWLRSYSTIAVRLEASGDGIERVEDRRLAMARALAVREHLIEAGVPGHQVVAIDVAEPGSRRQQVLTRIDAFQFAGTE
jgi:outer membrane protein OmpA-like peptidoglycan-associated protein